MQKHLYLCGFMGAGKSTVGHSVSCALSLGFIDTDQWIENHTGTTIAQLFAQHGEPYFRELEQRALVEICKSPVAVIATGGGMLMRSQNVECMKKSGIICYLDTPFALCYQRIYGDSSRPIGNMKTKQQLLELYQKRTATYGAAADFTLSGDKNLIALTTEIVEFLA